MCDIQVIVGVQTTLHREQPKEVKFSNLFQLPVYPHKLWWKEHRLWSQLEFTCRPSSSSYHLSHVR